MAKSQEYHHNHSNKNQDCGQNRFWAARHNKTSECLASLLARPDLTTGVNQKDWAGQTPLSLAVSRNAMMCVQLLLRDGRTDPNIKDDRMGATPLMLAVKTNHVDCVELLLADPRVDLMTRDNCKRSKAEVSRWLKST